LIRQSVVIETHHCLEHTKDGIYCRGVGWGLQTVFWGRGGSAVLTYS